jgi:8-oxo-dGTP diphosphatase
MKHTGFIANAYIENDDGKVLMVNLKKIGKWGLPGGKVEPGELPRQTLKRELLEELGIEIEIQELIGFREYFWEGDGHHWIDLIYKAKIAGDSSPEIKESEKISSIAFRDKNELAEGTILLQ